MCWMKWVAALVESCPLMKSILVVNILEGKIGHAANLVFIELVEAVLQVDNLFIDILKFQVIKGGFS